MPRDAATGSHVTLRLYGLRGASPSLARSALAAAISSTSVLAFLGFEVGSFFLSPLNFSRCFLGFSAPRDEPLVGEGLRERRRSREGDGERPRGERGEYDRDFRRLGGDDDRGLRLRRRRRSREGDRDPRRLRSLEGERLRLCLGDRLRRRLAGDRLRDLRRGDGERSRRLPWSLRRGLGDLSRLRDRRRSAGGGGGGDEATAAASVEGPTGAASSSSSSPSSSSRLVSYGSKSWYISRAKRLWEIWLGTCEKR
eukprot:m.255218 g.255218  ORF g.255218 m.255218 type:complete len:254 (+) comp15944_c0_seq34:1224-1985(+)